MSWIIYTFPWHDFAIFFAFLSVWNGAVSHVQWFKLKWRPLFIFIFCWKLNCFMYVWYVAITFLWLTCHSYSRGICQQCPRRFFWRFLEYSVRYQIICTLARWDTAHTYSNWEPQVPMRRTWILVYFRHNVKISLNIIGL